MTLFLRKNRLSHRTTMMRTGTSGTPTMTRSEKLKEHNMFRSLREVLRLNLRGCEVPYVLKDMMF